MAERIWKPIRSGVWCVAGPGTTFRTTPARRTATTTESGGLSVVMDRCIKVEHARYIGRMHWLGFNTGRITSVRGGLQ
jgi:hypothetical protein